MENEPQAHQNQAKLCLKTQHYEVTAFLEANELANFFRAQDLLWQRPVLLKVLKSELMQDSSAFKPFLEEARILAKLNHPNIITVYDFGAADSGEFYTVLEFIEGIRLSNYISERGPLSYHEALPIMAQLCDGLEHAHKKSVLHLNLSTEDIFLTESNKNRSTAALPWLAKIVDFSSARMNSPEGQLKHVAQALANDKACYFTPEQIQKKRLDERSDVFCLSSLLYQMLTAKAPFTGAQMKACVRGEAFLLPEKIRTLDTNSPLSKELQKIMFRGLSQLAEDRFKSVREFKEAIYFAVGRASAGELGVLFEEAQSWLKNKNES